VIVRCGCGRGCPCVGPSWWRRRSCCVVVGVLHAACGLIPGLTIGLTRTYLYGEDPHGSWSWCRSLLVAWLVAGSVVLVLVSVFFACGSCAPSGASNCLSSRSELEPAHEPAGDLLIMHMTTHYTYTRHSEVASAQDHRVSPQLAHHNTPTVPTSSRLTQTRHRRVDNAYDYTYTRQSTPTQDTQK